MSDEIALRTLILDWGNAAIKTYTPKGHDKIMSHKMFEFLLKYIENT